jgi:hypothetical protein
MMSSTLICLTSLQKAYTNLKAVKRGVNRQSNVKVKITGSDMSGLRSDMSGLGRYVLFGGRICPVTRNFVQRKSRSGAKTMHLGPDKVTISKLDNMELREIMGTTRSNKNSSIQI